MDKASNHVTRSLADGVTERDHVLGSSSAPITLLEYGDYECPSCLSFVPVLREVRKTLGEKLRYVFRHFPQSSVHPHASAAAEAAEAAADQGKFWEMHAALFQRQRELGEIDFDHLALTLGLEFYKFESSRSSEKHRHRVLADYESGVRSGVTKTPTLFINGNMYADKIDAAAILAACVAA